MTSPPVLIIFVASFISLLLPSAHGVSIWPQPQNLSSGNGVASVDPSSFAFVIDSQCSAGSDDSALLKAAFERYYSFIFWAVPSSPPPIDSHRGTSLQTVSVCVQQPDVKLAFKVDESYQISVDAQLNAEISAKTVWGALHGLVSGCIRGIEGL